MGELARGNAARNPVRTAATLLPLTIGLALTGFLVTLAAGTKASSLADFDGTIHADLHVKAAGVGLHTPRMSPAVLDRMAAVPELDAVSAFRSTKATVAGREGTVTGADPARTGRMLSPKVTGTPLSDLGPGGMAVSREAADDRHLTVGSPVTVRTARGEREYTVRTIIDAPKGYFALPFGDYFLASSDYANLAEDRGVTEIYATARDGVGQDAARAAAAQALAAHPGVEVTDRGDMRREVAAELDPALRVYYSLLGLVIVIALFGVANTLSLSILERVRELGLLRAVGMDRRQVRSLIRWEAIIIAGIAAVTGPVLGAFLGWATTVALGLPETAVPVANLALFTAVAIAMTAVAAALPARRAARVPMLRALSAD
ncbi:ABC transporter permease [Actinomadura madurae]|uniref:ABC transporter permease n=1 Tax=Actinomadura madurae TaxID=1993 RepID=UPI0020D2437D|nr:FtsX-like permease family protein [Actinomadura madurae]MCP9970992.1 ABC transporter permease [Actinomadura madurae]